MFVRVLDDSDFETEAELPSLDSFISRDILKKLNKNQKKWQELVNGKHSLPYYILIVIHVLT